MKRFANIIIALLVAIAALPASADNKAQADKQQTDKQAQPKSQKLSPSVARQLRLKAKLLALRQQQTLAQVVDHNRQSWEKLTPDQQDQFRQYAKAFLDKSPEEQAKLLRRYEKLIKMTAAKRAAYRRRAAWLGKVVATLTDEQKQALQAMTPQQRAKELLRLRDDLVEEGKIKLPKQQTKQPAPDKSSD